MAEQVRTCARCGRDRPASDYYEHSEGRPRRECRECWRGVVKARRDRLKALAQLALNAGLAPQDAGAR